MKRIFIITAALFMTASVWSQAPQKMSYQAVVRDASNTLISSTSVGVKVSILKGSEIGTEEYVETQTAMTNINGLVSLKIGEGTVLGGNFSNIDWANDSYFIKTDIDPNGGTDYTISGSSELLSVPYALHAETSGDSGPWTENGSNIYYNGGNVSIGSNSNDGAKLLIVGDGTQRVLRVQSTLGITNFLVGSNSGTTIGYGVNASPANGLLVGGKTILRDSVTVKGTLGINTAIPKADLHVSYKAPLTGTGPNGFLLENTENANSTAVKFQLGETSGSLYLYNKAGGLLGYFNGTSGAYSSSSDERLKNDFQPLASTLENLMKLKPLTYNYNNQTNDKRHVGFIAQEVEQVFPLLVSKDINEDGNTGNYTIDYSGFGVIAVKAIQEQQEYIEKLESRMLELEKRLEALEK